MLSMSDENGKPRVGLVVGNDGLGLDLSDENGKTRAVLAVNKEGSGLRLDDANGKTIWQAPQSAPVAVTPGTK
jgi:hypothetical protein